MGLTLFMLLLAFAAQQAQGARVNAIVDNYEAHSGDEAALDVFHRWIERHNRVYHSLSEKQRRFRIFKDNLQYIHQHNKQQKSYWMGLNKFSDLTHEEFRSAYLGTKPAGRAHRLRNEADFIYEDVVAEPSVDWRAKGAVSEVKDQGACGNVPTNPNTSFALRFADFSLRLKFSLLGSS